jgi:hypothetical protein
MRIGILVVHGMGVQSEQEFAVAFIAEMRSRLAARGVTDADVEYGAGFWADLLNDRERALLDQMRAGGPLGYRRLRGFIVEALGDAIAYRRGTTDGDNFYYRLHARVRERLAALRARLGDVDAPLVVVAHSLGSVIASDYVWDAQHPETGRAQGANPFERMETLAGLVTFGSTIPLFTLALPRVVAIAPPRASLGLPDAVRAVARWDNYYDPDDVLGWPLKTIAPGGPLAPGEHAYADAVDADHAIEVGGPLTGWNPLAHTGYWGDRSFLEPVAARIAAVAQAARAVSPPPPRTPAPDDRPRR